ncbi:heat-inducible transcriptional repressor HrcA [Brevibacterium litoralis]|uniref:heat-inducible transcriptional repressor HrcA n=1 Tax=Brevibacterium litoralis TaxID=3138935 RepID=UPI0032EBCDB3
MNDDRRARVLRAIVEDYVSTNEPVGSKAIVDRHGLGVSPATIRNDMAALEQDGLIAQPHTSAGRIPTDKGYRRFVDWLDEVKPLSSAERRAIARVIEQPVDIDEMLDRTVRLLAQLTHQVAVVQYPVVTRARVKHLELVVMGPGRLLAVLISDTGQVEQRLVDLGRAIGEDQVAVLRDAFNQTLVGSRLDRVRSTLHGIEVAPALREAAAAVTVVVDDLARANRQERLLMAGTANLARSGPEFGVHIGPLLEAFEEQVVLLRLLTDMAEADDRVAVRIGRENPVESFATTSVVSAHYGGESTAARLAVLGPTRMDYPTTIAAVRAVAKYVSVVLEDRT